MHLTAELSAYWLLVKYNELFGNVLTINYRGIRTTKKAGITKI